MQVLLAVLLVAALGLEILPSGFVVPLPSLGGEQAGDGTFITALQVCNQRDPFLGALFDFPVLVPTAPGLLPTAVMPRLLQDATAFIPEEFHPAIDHPPQLSA